MNRIPILNELKELAPGLAHLPVAMPYTLPQGYFEALPDNLLNGVKNDELYFNRLFSTKEMPYQVPATYFENLPVEILNKVNSYYKRNVPEGYFDTLPAILLNKVRSMEVAQELATVAPLLNTISKKPVQAVPDGYFEQLQPAIVQPVTRQMPVISIKKKNGWLKYAVAASVLLILSFGALKYFGKPPYPQDPQYVKVTPEQVKAFDKDLAQLDVATIENYLQENESVTDVNADLYKDMQNEDIESLLQDFTEQELQQQLQDNPDIPTLQTKKI